MKIKAKITNCTSENVICPLICFWVSQTDSLIITVRYYTGNAKPFWTFTPRLNYMLYAADRKKIKEPLREQ